MLILHSANQTYLPEIQEGNIKMRGSGYEEQEKDKYCLSMWVKMLM